MFFTLFLALTTVVIAASAAFFSVYGMAHIYAAAAIPIMIMGGGLEAGKLMAASYLYRHWESTGKLLKTVLFAQIIILMTITSLGIFGYLTAAYQTDSIPLKETAQKIQDDQEERTRLLKRNEEINAEISNLKNNIVNGRIKLEEQRKPEVTDNKKRIAELDNEISELQSKQLNTEAHVGPIIFVAKALGRQPDEAIFWFTLLIMSAFDPLAVALTLATNISMKHHKEKKVAEKSVADAKEIPELPKKPPYRLPTEPPFEVGSNINTPPPTPAEDRSTPVPPPPVTVTVEKTVEIEKTVEVEKSTEAARRALLAAARK